MSKLGRSIKRLEREMAGEERWYDEWISDLESWWFNCWLMNTYYNIRNFIINLPLFLRMAWKWRPWDSGYTINAFCDMLEVNAKACKSGYHVRGEQVYRRCMTASGKLRKAYDYGVDPTLSYLFKKNPICFRRIETSKLSEMYTKQVTKKKIYDGMYKIASDRGNKNEAAAKKEAWEYVHKYIEHFWD